MKRLLISLLGIFSYIFGGLSRSETSQGSFSGRISEPSTNSFLPITSSPNTALLAGQDGMVYLVELNSGEILWSFKSGPPIYASSQALYNYDNDKGDNYNASEPIEFIVDYGEDGNLYMKSSNNKKVKIQLTAEEFIGRTPIVTADGGVIVGSKNTTVFLISPKTGKVFYTFKSGEHIAEKSLNSEENPIMLREDIKEWPESHALDFKHKEQSLYVLRKDYTLKYFSRKTGKKLWYLTFSDFEASLQCQDIGSFGEYSSNPKDDIKVGPNWPFSCASNTVVYKIRDNSLLESFLKQHLGDPISPLPAPLLAPALKPGLKTGLLALPSSEMQSGVLGLPAGDSGITMSTTAGPKFLNGSLIWTVLVLATSLGPLFYARHLISGILGKGISGILGKGIAEQNVKTVTVKKKKTRKSGMKNSPRTENINEDGTNRHRFSKMRISEKEIAMGSNGTVVFEGIYEGRQVAIKRLVNAHQEVAGKEIQNLIAADSHPNIVRWFGVESDQHFTFLALERCDINLNELIHLCFASYQNQAPREDQVKRMMEFQDVELWKPNSQPSDQLLGLLSDIVSGLAYLHELGIIHRDLKPQNILIVRNRSISAKISDMGISKRLTENKSSLTQSLTGYGSSGWQAPEQLNHERQTLAMDLFCLGCIFFFCLTGGKHPFGENLERDVNIVNGKKDLFILESYPEAMDLITHLLDPKPDLRPKAAEVKNHPFFWNSEMRLSFLRDASDRVELENRSASEILSALESIATTAFSGLKWDDKIDASILNNLERYRRYNFGSVRDLLRVIRNKLNHYRELSADVVGILGPVPHGFNNYFSTRYPNLLMEVYKVLRKYCSGEESLHRYFKITL